MVGLRKVSETFSAVILSRHKHQHKHSPDIPLAQTLDVLLEAAGIVALVCLYALLDDNAPHRGRVVATGKCG